MKTVLRQLKQYKKDAWQCIGLTCLEVVMEILLPFVTARIIDEGLQAANLGAVYRYGILMVVMAFVSLACGAFAGKAAAAASSGLAANLRESIYAQIQTFSFSNIDRFSVPGHGITKGRQHTYPLFSGKTKQRTAFFSNGAVFYCRLHIGRRFIFSCKIHQYRF